MSAVMASNHQDKRLAIDLDGPLYEFDKTMRYMLREYRGSTGLKYPSQEWLMPNQSWHNFNDEDWAWLWSDGVRLGLFRHGHVTKHAIKALYELRDAGWSLNVLTHRPTEARAMKDTMAWLKFHFGKDFFDDICVKPERSKGLYTGAYTLIDDKLENLEAWTATGRPAIMFSRPWNERTRYQPRADGWYRVLEILGAR